TAGNDASARYAHAEAAHHYAIAVDILRDTAESARTAEMQCRLAGELFDLNQLPEAVESYEAALATFERLGDGTGQAVGHWGLGRVHQAQYNIGASVQEFDAALDLWPPERQDGQLARLLHDAGRAKTFSADVAAAIQLAERALALAVRSGDAGL